MATFTDPEYVIRLAAVFLQGAWSHDALKAHAKYAFLEEQKLVVKLARNAWTEFGGTRPSRKMLVAFLAKTLAAEPNVREVRKLALRVPEMTPRWNVPVLVTPGKLAEWLDVPLRKLDWFADVKGLTFKQNLPKLRHYVTVQLPRQRGKSRLLEMPKPKLKAIQRRILHEILDRVPPHDAAHGFRKGRSILSYVQPHVGRRIVLRFDLRDFFASISAVRVAAIFRAAGYPPRVAWLLAGLCTTRTSDDIPAESRWRSRHLPQGAPTSPSLANLAAYRLDIRLAALANRLGASYTRYADDLAFSGDDRLLKAARRVQVLVAIIAAEEGFELHFQKSRFMRNSLRQQLAGVVVNERPNIDRISFDTIKAILYNCVRHGPESQNRDKLVDFRRHLLGRVAYVKMLNLERGATLQGLFDRIDWHQPGADS